MANRVKAAQPSSTLGRTFTCCGVQLHGDDVLVDAG